MNTIWQQHCIDNQSAKEFIELESYIGRRVKHIVYTAGTDKTEWSESIHTITSFDDDVCGDGCCNGFEISDSLTSWRSDQLLLVEDR